MREELYSNYTIATEEDYAKINQAIGWRRIKEERHSTDSFEVRFCDEDDAYVSPDGTHAVFVKESDNGKWIEVEIITFLR